MNVYSPLIQMVGYNTLFTLGTIGSIVPAWNVLQLAFCKEEEEILRIISYHYRKTLKEALTFCFCFVTTLR